jgi:2-succinyl-5-enolpyruvyl-6-hydroxy-3-cyclohexene-1-carboxylate synthase
MYDLVGPWAARQLPEVAFTIFVINNGGGQIFKKMFRSELFMNRHEQSFEAWARFWKLGYNCWTRIPESEDAFIRGNDRQSIVEIRPNEYETDQFWKSWEAKCKEI